MPDHMTVLGVLAALGIGAAYWLSGRDPAWLWVASGLLVVHWLGDSLDGTLARVRRIERPKYGYYLDHLVDAGATIAIGAGLGLSPYMGLATGLAVVIAYLALSINTYLETQVFGVFSLGYGRFGPTEARVGLIAAQPRAAGRGDGRPRHRRPRDRGPDAGRAGRARRAQPARAGRARARGRGAHVGSPRRADRLPRPPPPRRRRHARRGVLHGGQRRALPRGGGGAGDQRAGRRRAHPSLHPVARHLAAPVVAASGRATTSTTTAPSCARRPTCGSASRPTSSPAARTGSRTSSMPASGTTSSAPCTSSPTRRSTWTTVSVWGRGQSAEKVWKRYFETVGEAARDRACSTSWPTPTW